MKSMRSVRSLGAGLSVLLIVGCGGGGGASPAAAPPTVTITAANQGTVTRATVDGTQALGASQPLSVLDRATARSVTAPAALGAGMLQLAVRRGLLAAFMPRRTLTIASAARPAAASSSTDLCETSGSVTTTLNDTDNSQSVSSGDSLSLTFNQCRSSAGDTVDGTMVFTVSGVTSAVQGNVRFSGSLAFQQVDVTSGTRSASIGGSVGVAAAITSTSFQLALTVGGSGLTVATSAPGYLNTIVYDPNMQLTVTATDGVVEQAQVTLDGSFTASSIGGRILIDTVQPVTQLGTDAYPSSGQVVVTGAGGTRLRITALDATQVQLELDANGDGAYERSGVFVWSTLGTS